jgi:hypothetical protein
MKKVLCLEDGMEYLFDATSGYDAIQKMLYTLDIAHKDCKAKIQLCNSRTWSLEHNGKTYACAI